MVSAAARNAADCMCRCFGAAVPGTASVADIDFASLFGFRGNRRKASARGRGVRLLLVGAYPNAPTSCVIAVAISRTMPNMRRIGAKISSFSRT